MPQRVQMPQEQVFSRRGWVTRILRHHRLPKRPPERTCRHLQHVTHVQGTQRRSKQELTQPKGYHHADWEHAFQGCPEAKARGRFKSDVVG